MQEKIIETTKKKYKVAIISPAPFYYHTPLYCRLGSFADIDLTVYYCSDETLLGMDVEKTYSTRGSFINREDLLKGYHSKFIKNYSPVPSYLTWPFGLINISIWQEIKNGKYDVVVLQAWTNITWWIAFFACLKFKTRVLFMTDANILSESVRSVGKKKIKKYILNFLFKKTDGFLTTGKANEEFYKYYGADPKKMTRFYFSWGYEAFFAKAQQIKSRREAIRKSLGIGEDDFLVLYVGRLSQEKNPGIILDAFNNLSIKNKKLFFVGDGPLRSEIEQKIKKTKASGVFLSGFQNHDKIGEFYAIADVLVLPSSSETWGIVVNEAMCFGVPIIASDQVGAAVDLVKNKYNGFVFPVGDTKELVNALNSLISMSKNERLSFGQKSSEIIKEWIDKIDPVQQLTKLLSDVSPKYYVPESANKRILMISPYIPWPMYGGTLVRIFNLLKELSERGYEIILFAGTEDVKILSNNPLNQICKEIHLFKLATGSSFSFVLGSIFSINPYPVSRFYTNSMKEGLQKLLTTQKFDLIWVNLSILVNILPGDLIKNTPILMDHPECEELVYKDYIKGGNMAQKFFSFINLIKLIKFHEKVFSRVSTIFCVSKEEADFTMNQTKGKINVWVVPNGVDGKTFYPAEFSENKPNRILLCSGMSVRRNIDALVWFTKRIFPQIKEQVSDAEFWIVGSNPSHEVLQLNSIPGVKVVGTVENIEDYYRMGKVFVAPYRFGAGTKLKVFEAMASGVPIVSTAIGCRGIDVINGHHILIADSEVEFARCVVDLLQNRQLAQKLAQNALALIKDKYYWKKIVDDLEPKMLETMKKKI